MRQPGCDEHLERLEQLRAWIEGRRPGAAFDLEPASADASFRRYFRVRYADGASLIAMDAPPAHEDCRPFMHVAGLLAAAGLNAPRVEAQDLAQGFLLLTDLGNTTFLAAMGADAGVAHELFDDATTALVRWQAASRLDVLPPYDAALLRRELDLFPDWYVARHLGIVLTPAQKAVLERTFALVIAANLAQPKVFVHRDYMPRNLMVCDPNPGILDFQDAVYGPITYDVASLFRDAFVSWDEENVLDWTVRYWEKARKAGLPVAEDFAAFYRDFEWMGLQRHLKVLGIFARLEYRDGKSGYLEDTPRFVAYVRAVAARYTALHPLLLLFDELAGRSAGVGYTF
ncbi:MAG: phosphotransferase [Burkholderiales bacterium]|nr:phosphotransferase [Burkholderiales bacterium]